MHEINAAELRLRASENLSDILAGGFDAFEAIRTAARGCEDRDPAFFAAFMMAGPGARCDDALCRRVHAG